MQPVRRTSTRILLACTSAIVATTLMAAPAFGSQISPANLRVCIDPGHGGGYSGAVAGGAQEADLNLQIAKRLSGELSARGIDAVLTRSSDSLVWQGSDTRTWRWSDVDGAYLYDYWPVADPQDRLTRDLQARCDAANASGADLFVSIHNNAASSRATGAEVWRAPNDPLGEQLGADVQGCLTFATGAGDRGVFSANFYVIRWTSVPAVLVECGFVSTPSELARLRSASYQKKIAKGIADGIARFAARPVEERFDRLWGGDRYATAVEVSRRGWPTRADTVVLVSGETFADSLVSGPLAASLDAPILSAAADGLPEVIAAEIARLSPRRVVVVGGVSAVPPAVVERAAQVAGISADAVTRIGGSDRYATAVDVARALKPPAGQSVVVASGESFPDALSIAASAAQRGEPILLTSAAGLSTEAQSFIAAPADPRTVTVVGGPAVVPDAAMGGLAFVRLWGSDRYETNWAVLDARYSEEERRRPMVASAGAFADSLVLGPLAAKESRPVLLVGKTATSRELRPWVYERRDAVLEPLVVGGPAAVSAYLDPMFEKMRMRSYQ